MTTTDDTQLPTAAATPAWMVPETLPQAMELAKQLGSSGMFPERYRNNPGAVLLVMDYAQRLNVPPLMLAQKMYEVSGSVGFEYPLLIALLKRNGYRIEWHESDPPGTWAMLTLTDPRGGTFTEQWDEDRAKTTGVYIHKQKSNLWAKWQNEGKSPITMLRARCVSSAVRAFAAEVTCGPVYAPDELDDIREAEIAAAPPIDQRPGVAGMKARLGISVEPESLKQKLHTYVAAHEISTDDYRAVVEQVCQRLPTSEQPMTDEERKLVLDELELRYDGGDREERQA